MSDDFENESRDNDTDSKGAIINTLLKKFLRIITVAIVIVVVVAIIGAVFSFITRGELVRNYVFYPNFVVAVLIIVAGLIGPRNTQGILGFIRMKSKQFSAVVTEETYNEFMEERKQKRLKGKEILWVGIAAALITGITEIIVWLLV